MNIKVEPLKLSSLKSESKKIEEKCPQPHRCMGKNKSRPVGYIMGVSEKEESKRNRKNIWGNNGRNFLNMMKSINSKSKKFNELQIYKNLNRHSIRHTVIKLSKAKAKQRNLKASAEEQRIIHKRSSVQLTPISHQDPSRLEDSGMEYSKHWKKKCQPRILYIPKLSFRIMVTIQHHQKNKS